MPRARRTAIGGVVYHVLNRAVARTCIFHNASDYAAFEQVLSEACQRVPMRIACYCLMPNHWHMVLWPRSDSSMSQFMAWLTQTHTQRWHVAHGTVGTGPLYQGRFKSFPIESDLHYLKVCRYVEQNPFRAGLVRTVQGWRWSSLWVRTCGTDQQKAVLSDGPTPWPADWLSIVSEPPPTAELARLRQCAQNERAFGSGPWVQQMMRR